MSNWFVDCDVSTAASDGEKPPSRSVTSVSGFWVRVTFETASHFFVRSLGLASNQNPSSEPLTTTSVHSNPTIASDNYYLGSSPRSWAEECSLRKPLSLALYAVCIARHLDRKTFLLYHLPGT